LEAALRDTSPLYRSV